MEKPLCKKCKNQLVHIKKAGLCATCYARDWKKERKRRDPRSANEADSLIATHRRELDFIRNYFTHNDWIYSPALFSLVHPEGYVIKYSPDFYDKRENVFIEVAGTRQAYHANKDKYELFNSSYPHFKLEVRYIDGSLLSDGKFHGPNGINQ